MARTLQERFGKSAKNVLFTFEADNPMNGFEDLIRSLSEIQKEFPNLVLYPECQTWYYEDAGNVSCIIYDEKEFGEIK